MSAEVLGAVISAIVAIVSVIVAIGANRIAAGARREAREANRHAAESNRIAESARALAAEAVNLQGLIDAREREFRDVTWRGTWASAGEGRLPVFRVSNTGLTEAHSVTVVYPYNGVRYHATVDVVPPGGSIDVSGPDWEDPSGAVLELMLFEDTPFTVHWSSPMGYAESYEHPGRQIY